LKENEILLQKGYRENTTVDVSELSALFKTIYDLYSSAIVDIALLTQFFILN